MSQKDTNNQLLREAIHLQAMEGNPLDARDIEMFEMFEREGWSHEKRLVYIRKRAKSIAIEPVENDCD